MFLLVIDALEIYDSDDNDEWWMMNEWMTEWNQETKFPYLSLPYFRGEQFFRQPHAEANKFNMLLIQKLQFKQLCNYNDITTLQPGIKNPTLPTTQF